MNTTRHKGIIAWFAVNPVAANLLMFIIIAVGLASGIGIKRTMMPEFEIDIISITIPYPGAAPEEVEQGIVLKIEEALADLEGIARIEADAMESLARIIIEPEDSDDIAELTDRVKNRIDAIPHMPEGAEKPIIGRIEVPFQALMIQISGDLDERSMKELAEQIKLELVSHPDISSIGIWGSRDYEIAIEISEHQLQEYHLTLDDVADIVAASSIDLPGGAVRTENGDIMLRTRGQAYRQADFEAIVLRTFADGTRLLLGDIAIIEDGFTDTTGFAVFNGKYSVGLPVMAMGAQDIMKASRAAKDYVRRKNASLPDNVELTIWSDFSYYLDERLGMMMNNLAIGAVVVFIVLALFLEIKLAFWVMVGIPICFLGAMALFASPLIGGTLNIVSAFAFILVLGIVVDDAIIIGESVCTEQEQHGHSIEAVIGGARRVATPATFGVLTTIAAFTPILFIDGFFSVFGDALGWIVVFCLIFSLIESKWILPAHLAHSKPPRQRWLLAINRVQQLVNRKLQHFVEYRYQPFLWRCIDYRYVTVATFVSLLILSIGLMGGGQVRVHMAPEIDGEFIQVDVRMADGTPQQRTLQVITEVAETLHGLDLEYREQYGGPLLANIFAFGQGHVEGFMLAELVRTDQREYSTRETMDLWRTRVGRKTGAEVLSFSADDSVGFGSDIAFDLSHSDWEVLQLASTELENKLRSYAGLYDVRSSISSISDEFHIDILPEAESLGITRRALGSQVRHAFYGAEAQRIQRDTHEIKVMVRYPRADRRNTATLNSMFIRTPQGDSVPFNSVASLRTKPGFNQTTRIDFQRAVEVTAEAESDQVESGRVTAELLNSFLPQLVAKYPGLAYARSGLSQEESKLTRSLITGFALALFAIYSLLAIPTKSYLQPLIIMGVIPFGIIGAVFGHLVTGYSISMVSLMGIVALSGVVVNDSLIMVDYVNRSVRAGATRGVAATQAGMRRFRAIVLTSMTTFCALIPMLLETSTQAEVVIPMAISLAFGIVFATVITLLLVPTLYVILDDLTALFRVGQAPSVAGDPAETMAGNS